MLAKAAAALTQYATVINGDQMKLVVHGVLLGRALDCHAVYIISWPLIRRLNQSRTPAFHADAVVALPRSKQALETGFFFHYTALKPEHLEGQQQQCGHDKRRDGQSQHEDEVTQVDRVARIQ